ncbi:MAG TPA: endonuclease III [Elusimicrobia bacterium]|nr:MAG: endonuclease III [Elusimicrobia bacterium RIFOXYA12_FULL_49_49]OGS09904.1 MAG: endonuclease III [Elusimicrobia bacterium RIFOXYA1_FULL_47_7]OGS10009.1 MAG: endonuclease III [Elusimicrobia bacterium RIFOXYB1_FULL_48_9]OGS15479.1 MAG: endonuclease III [Elusimicrobia bacterium RIFOXYA2_FULL_47_53]OGS26974.1 MAG: endonuclease III [Elusimicrobia bacterium RIFOXYB12_FULL_50_12]OGS30919.1 MAG: endonuclease III [Elusimicrobia bacterium RIFOXYB2_FULL_46_23]HBU70104.1 endonuclease III [Elusimic
MADAKEIVKRLKKHYPEAGTKLEFSNPLEILVATILSAQCTDERVNKVTKTLFKKYRSAAAFAKADIKEFERDIHSTGFYRNKAKNIIASAKMIVDQFGGRVPSEMEDLLKLPGVARKTANVVMGNAFNKFEGIVVDTHVIRISQRLGLTKNSAPEKIELDLMKQVHKKDWFVFSHLLQAFGRDICRARNPAHASCPLEDICPSSSIQA